MLGDEGAAAAAAAGPAPVAKGLFVQGSSNVVVCAKSDIEALYAEGCFGSSATTASLKPLFLRKSRRRFRDLDSDSSWAEPWKLNLFEAFYLVDRGRLEVAVAGSAGGPLRAAEAWALFGASELASSMDHFAALYAAYAALKAQGWVVKLGTTYGANFVVYQGDPDFFHSQFCVVVRVGDKLEAQPSSWIDVTREMRVANQTAKDVMLCDVTLTQASAVPSCSATVDFVILLRWMLKHEEPGKERQPHQKLKRKLIDPAQKAGRPAKQRTATNKATRMAKP